jgi:CBS-domain-containing membrane protein
MVNHNIGRLPVVEREDRRKVIGMVTRSDLLSAHRRRLRDATESNRMIDLRALRKRRSQLPEGNGSPTPATK